MFSRDRQRRIERVELEHHGDVALFRRQVVHAPAGDDDVAAVACSRPAIMRKRRGLAAARGPEQADDLACRDRQIDVLAPR